MHYFSLNIDDFRSGTSHMTRVERMLYLDLLLTYYHSEKPLPEDTTKVARMIGARTLQERHAVAHILNDKFLLCEDGWHNIRADEEIARYHAKSDTARRSAKQRWEDRRANAVPTHDANALQSQSASNGKTMLTKEPNNLSLSSNEEREKQPRKRASRLPEDWQPSAEDFAYCRKQRPDLDPYEVAAAFRDYWHASGSKTAAKLDWAAAWRTWVRNEKKSLKTPAFESAKDAQRRAVLESFTSSQPPLIDITPPTDDPFTLT